MTGFFLYTGASEIDPATGNPDPHDEIDVEIAGSNPRQLRLTYWTNDQPTSIYLDLPFDASVDYHNYAFEWMPGGINWYVDGELIHQEVGDRGALPTHSGKLMINYWAGDNSSDSWLGEFEYKNATFAYFKNPVLEPLVFSANVLLTQNSIPFTLTSTNNYFNYY